MSGLKGKEYKRSEDIKHIREAGVTSKPKLDYELTRYAC